MNSSHTANNPKRPSLSIPLRIESPVPLGPACQPVTVGVPLPKGALNDPGSLRLADETGRALPVQTEVLARWSDGSIRWLLVDFLLDESLAGSSSHVLRLEETGQPAEASVSMEIREGEHAVLVDTGKVAFQLDREGFEFLRDVRPNDLQFPSDWLIRTCLLDGRGRPSCPVIEAIGVETRGPVRSTLCLEGSFPTRQNPRFRARLSFFEGTGLVRLRLTIHNPNRARHRGGLWDLGDPGSFFFDFLSLDLNATFEPEEILWKADVEKPLGPAPGGTLEIYQDSSGGENWKSRNHVNRYGNVPCHFRGYRVRTAEGEQEGFRATPVVALRTHRAGLTVAVPEFWQQFPKSLHADHRGLGVGLFPHAWSDPFELQGGEQKTHTVWLCFDPTGQEAGGVLDWVHRPARVLSTPAWYAGSGALPQLLPAEEDPDDRLCTLLDGALRGPKSLPAGREAIDEYGWRNFGEVYADHENAYYKGTPPVISHYNNQFDVVYGAILQQMRTGDTAWSELFDPLARHVTDIDVYHTHQDRAAYNGGLFWLTDHYLSAETCTHRTYSRTNRPASGAPYGGGPGCEHNYATGLLHYYYLTGDRDALAAVFSLADWVLAMDDGANTVFGLLDDGPTGLASATDTPDYHGPGRGCGNSIHALLDGWLAGRRRQYLDKAEALIRRTIHPLDDVASRNLLDVEAHWSYTIYLAALARYLEVKIEQGDVDFMYAYGRAALLHYARWMLENERPYFDHPEDLEYPTEAWAAQEFRKANALRLAARHADEPLRSELLERGGELADRAWSDLLRFESRWAARAVAILTVEGMRDAYWRATSDPPAPPPAEAHDFGTPEEFIPQRTRVLTALTTKRGLARALGRLIWPKNWSGLLSRISERI